MKMFNKKTNITLAFCLGAVLFVSTAFAEIRTKTGYEEMKDAVKQTAALMLTYDSYSAHTMISIENNGKIIMQNYQNQKQDNQNDRSENSGTSVDFNRQERHSYNYRDSEKSIYYSSHDDTYYLTNLYKDDSKGYNQYRPNQTNPFDEPMVKDFEKILDAGVALLNLQNSISAEKNSDGSITLYSSLGEGQIPPFINALFSFVFKQSYGYRNVSHARERVYYEDDMVDPMQYSSNNNIPALDGDVFIKSVNGRMEISVDGAVEQVFLTAVISGVDKDGIVQNMKFELNAKISDINETVVNVPDLTGKNVVVNEHRPNDPDTVPEAFIGSYKSDIIDLKDNIFIKTGAKHLDIISMENGTLIAKYWEVIDGENTNEKDIEARIDSPYSAHFDISEQDKDEYFEKPMGYLSFNYDDGSINYHDGSSRGAQFTRIFE